MAKIFKTNDQERALKEIIDSLKVVDSLNEVLSHEDYKDFKMRLTGSSESGNLNEIFPIPMVNVSPVLKDYRKRLVKEIQDKAKTYAIALEDSEKEILGMRVES